MTRGGERREREGKGKEGEDEEAGNGGNTENLGGWELRIPRQNRKTAAEILTKRQKEQKKKEESFF